MKNAATLDFMYTNAMEVLDALASVDSEDTSPTGNSINTIDTVDANTDQSSEEGESKTNLKAMAGLVPQPFISKARWLFIDMIILTIVIQI